MKSTQTFVDYPAAAFQASVNLNPDVAAPDPMESLVREMLFTLGEDPSREGLLRTPERVARMYTELLSGYQTDLDQLINGAIFESEFHDMVVVRDIRFYSLCEHHLLPFFGQAHVAYIPGDKIIGLSKIPRIVEMFARRLQVQERLTHQIGETVEEILHPGGVAVLIEGTHMCSVMRGVKQSEAHMVTSTMLGAFQEDEALRNDFFNHLRLGNHNPDHFEKRNEG